jgi:hypothetical protein
MLDGGFLYAVRAFLLAFQPFRLFEDMGVSVSGETSDDLSLGTIVLSSQNILFPVFSVLAALGEGAGVSFMEFEGCPEFLSLTLL